MAINLAQVLTEFNAAGIDINADFYTLSISDACILHDLANRQGYRKPKNANGSTARYFLNAVQRKHNREQRARNVEKALENYRNNRKD